MRQPASAAPRARSTACGVAVALVLGLALIATGAQITARDTGAATLDGAHVLRQARWTPQQVAARQQQPAATTQLQNSPALTASPAAAAKVGALAPDVGGKGACLVSKWGAVWVVHTDGKTRSHVAMPTAECDLHASIIEDMDKYTKSHGGAGAYSLDERQSKEACMLAGCARHTHTIYLMAEEHICCARPWKRACVSAWQRARRR